MEMSFRKAQTADAENIVKLVNLAYRGDEAKKGWTTEADFLAGQRTDITAIMEIIQSSNSLMLLAEQNSEIWGCVFLQQEGRDCYVGMVTVNPQKQALGLGRQILAIAEDYAKKSMKAQKVVMTVITLRHELIAWYERRGYRRTGQKTNFPYGNVRYGIPLRPDLEMEYLEKSLY